MTRTTTPKTHDRTTTDPDGPLPNQCPLCQFAAADSTDVYVHLQTAHRKSSLAEALLDAEGS